MDYRTVSWPWIFWVNIPFGIAAIIAAWFILPEARTENIHRLDITGFLLFGVGLAGLVFGLSGFSEDALSLPMLNTILFISVILLIGYVWHSRIHAYPILNNHLFQIRTFRISILGNLFGRLGFNAMPFLLPLMLQLGLNYSPELAGSMVAVIAIGAMIVKSVSREILSRFGFKKTLIINTLLLGGSLEVFATVTSTTPLVLIVFYTLVFGLLISLQFSSMNPLAFADIGKEEMGSATSLHSVTMQVAQSIGVAMCAFILKKTHLNFSITFIIMGIITLLATTIFLFMKKEDGSSLYAE